MSEIGADAILAAITEMGKRQDDERAELVKRLVALEGAPPPMATITDLVNGGPDEWHLGVKTILGVDVERIEKWMGDPVQYVFHLADQRKLVVTGAQLDTQRLTRIAVGDLIGARVQTRKPVEWDAFIQCVYNLAVEVEVAPEATDTGQVLGWVEDYLEHHPAIEADSEAATGEWPPFGATVWAEGTDVVITTTAFHQWITSPARGERVSTRQLAFMLKRAGATNVGVKSGTGPSRTTVRGWRLSGMLDK